MIVLDYILSCYLVSVILCRPAENKKAKWFCKRISWTQSRRKSPRGWRWLKDIISIGLCSCQVSFVQFHVSGRVPALHSMHQLPFPHISAVKFKSSAESDAASCPPFKFLYVKLFSIQDKYTGFIQKSNVHIYTQLHPSIWVNSLW